MMARAQHQLKPDEDASQNALQGIADSFIEWPRAPTLRYPDACGLEFEHIWFPSEDGLPLQGWFIPASGSRKIIIANHPRWLDRADLPPHLIPLFGSRTAKGPESDFIADYKILTDAGYNILAYDLRNFGPVGAVNGSVFSGGRHESRDVIGALRYVRSHHDLRHMSIGLFSRCVGANATLFAMTRRPDVFVDVRFMVCAQPFFVEAVLNRAFERLGIPHCCLDDLDNRVFLNTGFKIAQFSPIPWAKSVAIPTLLYQATRDCSRTPDALPTAYDALPCPQKKPVRIDGKNGSSDGYAYFQRQPNEILSWCEEHMT